MIPQKSVHIRRKSVGELGMDLGASVQLGKLDFDRPDCRHDSTTNPCRTCEMATVDRIDSDPVGELDVEATTVRSGDVQPRDRDVVEFHSDWKQPM